MIRNTIVCFALLALAVPTLWACNVPVFRYALEHWQPDPYEMVVLHQGPLQADEKRLIDSLPDKDKCNLTVSTIDWNKISGEDQAKLKEIYHIPQFPWVIVRYPTHAAAAGPAYSGPLQPEALRNLQSSPARAALAQRLLHGDSAVWILLESGDAGKDNAAEANLRTWLGKLEQTLKLPERTASSKDKLLREDLPLKMAFSILRLSRGNPEEKHLVRILDHMEKDLPPNEPMVIPVFGRGLALYVIVGKGITERNVADAASFMTGACSCEVKELNPGVDLLMTADWADATIFTPPQARPARDAVTLVPIELPRPKMKRASPDGGPGRTDGSSEPQPISTELSAGFFRMENPLLIACICVLMAALGAGYYATFRRAGNRRR